MPFENSSPKCHANFSTIYLQPTSIVMLVVNINQIQTCVIHVRTDEKKTNENAIGH